MTKYEGLADESLVYRRPRVLLLSTASVLVPPRCSFSSLKVPFSYNIGQGNVIKGWDEGVMDMGVGERAKLTCTPDYAYGEGG